MGPFEPMTQRYIHGDLLRVAEWLNEHYDVLASEYPEDDIGFPIVTGNPQMEDALRMMRDLSWMLTSVLSKLANRRVIPDPDL